MRTFAGGLLEWSERIVDESPSNPSLSSHPEEKRKGCAVNLLEILGIVSFFSVVLTLLFRTIERWDITENWRDGMKFLVFLVFAIGVPAGLNWVLNRK